MSAPLLQEHRGILNLTCVINIPISEIGVLGWYHNGELYKKATGQTITVFNPTIKDTGEYTCVAARKILPANIKTSNKYIQVIQKPPIELLGLDGKYVTNELVNTRKQKTTDGTIHIEMDSGEDLNVQCRANNNPDVLITWTREFNPYQSEKRIFRPVYNTVSDKNMNLTINDITMDDSGKYECIAANSPRHLRFMVEFTEFRVNCTNYVYFT